MRNKLIVLLVVLAAAAFMTTGVWAEEATDDSGNTPVNERYEQEDVSDTPANERYEQDAGEGIQDGWNEDRTQYFVSGEPVTGFFIVDGKQYYADEAGNVTKGSGILEVNKQKYILQDDVVLTGPRVVQSGGALYYIGEKGVMKTTAGFVDCNKNRYYVQAGGAIMKNKLFRVGSNSYCAAGNGTLRTGVVAWGGKYYYFNKNYTLKKSAGMVNAGGRKYYNRKNGGIATSTFVNWKKKYYYAGKTGAIAVKPFKYKGRTVRPDSKTGALSRTAYMIAIGKYKKSPYPYENYVLVDISSQTLSYYKYGKRKLKCKVVTGNVSAGHSTPKGKYRIRKKSRGVTLRGAGYASYVSYWMPFIGNSYGLHDASWRGRFGGKIYRSSGSHGCVNMPRKAARKLYSMVSVGTIVVIRA